MTVVATHMPDVGGTGDLAETLKMDWSHSPQASRQRYTTSLNLESRGGKGKEDDLETLGAAIWKQTSEKLVKPGDGWRGWLKTGGPGGVMLAAYAPGEATKALTD